MSATPIAFQADYVEPRSRLATFFRLLLLVPHAIALSLFSVAAYVVVIVAWFAIVITGRWPRGLYDFLAGYWRYATAVTGYAYLLTDEYPPFSTELSSYPVRLDIGPPRERYSRSKAAFRPLLAIPVALIAYAFGLVAAIGCLIAWFAIVLLGRQPRGLQDMTVLGLSYVQRGYAYLSLLDEDWPAIVQDADPALPGRAGDPPLAAQQPPAVARGDDAREPADPFGNSE